MAAWEAVLRSWMSCAWKADKEKEVRNKGKSEERMDGEITRGSMDGAKKITRWEVKMDHTFGKHNC